MKADSIITIIGGVITFLVGIGTAYLGYGLSAGLGVSVFDIIGAFGILGVIFGLILILLPIFAYPKGKKWAILGLVVSIISLLLVQGVVVGPVLAIVGSALAVKNSGKKK